MNDWLNKVTAKLKSLWSVWTVVQKAIAAGIVIAVIVVLVIVFKGSSKPSTVPLFNTPITDQSARDNITYRLDEENVKYTISSSGLISVPDETTARRMRSLLISEDLVPTRVDVFSKMLDVTNWSTTDFERQKNDLRRVTEQVKQHIEALDDVSSANVTITAGKDDIFANQREPATASVILRFKPGSVMQTDRKKIQGVQRLILHSVTGLTEDNITISDTDGTILNDFAGMAESDRVDIIKKEQKLRQEQEAQLSARVLSALQKNFKGRISDVVVAIEMDMSKKTSDKTIHTPIIITEQDPDKPYDTTEKRDYLPISSQTITKEWTGTGYNPEGPAGVEGQNPPVYSDMSNVIGKSVETGVTQNNVINTEQLHIESSPSYNRITASANIDGLWEKETDGNQNPIFVDEKNIDSLKEIYADWEDDSKVRFKLGHIVRVYHPISDAVREQAENFVKDAIGYNKTRGDSVTITSYGVPDTDEWDAEDEAVIKARNTRRAIMLVLVGVVVILISFIVFRMISRELERRRRLREEEILRRQQAEREKALWDAKQEGMEVTMSVEERKRAELQENAIAMAKEHPEDVAMLIRTWLMEE